MDKLLLETTVGYDIVCKYCGNPYAIEEVTNQSDFRPLSYRFKGDGGYGTSYYCQFCGWEEYEAYEGEDSLNDDIDDPFVKYEPEAEQIADGKKIVEMLKKASDEADEAIREALEIGYNPTENNLSDIKKIVVDYVFTDYRP